MVRECESAGQMDGRQRRRIAASVKRADALMREGRLDEAAARLECAVQADPRNVRYLVRLAGVRRGQGRMDEAILLADRALALKKMDRSAEELLLQLLLETGRYEEVIDHGKRAIRSSPRNLYARDLMGVAYLQLGQLEKALHVTNELVHLDPTDAGNHFKRAVLFQQKGDLGKAIREFSRVVELDPDGEIADEARDAITWLDSFQLRQIIGLAMEDNVFRAKLARDAEQAAAEKGFILSIGGVSTLKQIDFDRLGDPAPDWDQPTYN